MAAKSKRTDVEILLVEDDPDDVRLIEESVKGSKLANRITVAPDGERALALLRAGRRKPDLILLDLNLPGMDGKGLLKILKEDPSLRSIPVVILTSSPAEADIVRSYELHANCYIQKPVGFEELRKVVQIIEDFWFTIVRLPPR